MRRKYIEMKLMDEGQIIRQLKGLRAIKPNKDWVVLTKEEILGKDSPTQIFAKQKLGQASWVFAPVGRPAFVLSTLATVALILIGGLFYLNSQNASLVSTEGLHALLEKVISQSQNNKQVIASLADLKVKLQDIKVSLDDLKTAKDQGQALAVTEVVKATARRGGEVVTNVKQANSGLSKQVLASLQGIEDVSKELEEKSYSLQKEIFEAYLADLKQRSLDEEDVERLQKVEEYYAEGKMAEAMILITKIGK